MGSISVDEVLLARIGQVSYHLRFPPALEISSFAPKTQPALVIDSHLAVSGLAPRLNDLLFQFQSEDDVLTDEFARGATIFVNSVDEGTSQWSGLQTERNSVMPDRKLLSLESKVSLPKGPYFWRGNALHEAWRLYSDSLSAFVTPVVPTTDAFRFEPLRATTEDGGSFVAVPSRLYFEQTEEKPLNGKRIGIKDNIQLAGVKTTNGNRAYTECYGPQDETAEFVKKLIHQGAGVVGKQKPPDQYIDYFAPWNPRADGYLRTAGSTSGGGSSIAGYNWMDYAVGTDTTGSLREPARACGLYGLKAMNRIISAEGMDLL